MRIPRVLTIISGMVVLALLIGIGYLVTLPSGPVLTDAQFGSTGISPNADGKNDLTTVSYHIRRPATVSIYFLGGDGRRYDFRRDEPRVPGDYSVLFGGIVDGFVEPNEQVKGNVLARVLPNGTYQWVIEAKDQITGRDDRITGTLKVENADEELPDLWEFTISPAIFTPNQDGLDDRVWINVFVPKAATLSVYLVDQAGTRYFVPETEQLSPPGQEGRHIFNYDGGVDIGSSPPPDGTYQVVADAKDAIGQEVQRTGEVTIKDGGIPLAQIVAQPVGDTVQFSSQVVQIGDVLSFKLTVENYGNTPIRTTGPAPGYIYDQDQLTASTGFLEESGAWRVGIHCDTCLTDYPWRWALGSADNLTPIKDQSGRVHYYLMPHERSIVTGGIRIKTVVPSRNPQQFWAGLIHEDVGIAPENDRVDPHWIEIALESALTPTPTP